MKIFLFFLVNEFWVPIVKVWPILAHRKGARGKYSLTVPLTTTFCNVVKWQFYLNNFLIFGSPLFSWRQTFTTCTFSLALLLLVRNFKSCSFLFVKISVLCRYRPKVSKSLTSSDLHPMLLTSVKCFPGCVSKGRSSSKLKIILKRLV